MMKNEEELMKQFVSAVTDAMATVEVIPNDKKFLTDALLKATEDDDAVLFAEPNDIDAGLFSEFKKNPKVITAPSKEQLRTIRTGVTDSFGAVASTGSVCVPVTNNLTSPISMLTRKHIVVLNSTTIVSRPSDIFSEKYLAGKGLKRSFSFITGTSATADMGPLVRGVHGPGKLHIIVLE
jgi:L-lactate dehydrogenase complex protein LldG